MPTPVVVFAKIFAWKLTMRLSSYRSGVAYVLPARLPAQ